LDGLRQTGLVGHQSPAQVIVPLYRLRDLLCRGDKKIARRFGLTLAELEALIALRVAPPNVQLTPGDFQQQLILTSGGVAKILASLEAHEHIISQTNDADARSRLVELTPQGRKLVDEALPQLAEFNQKRLDLGLTRKEQVHLAELLQKLLKSIEA